MGWQGTKARHKDRGDGICEECLEDFPCGPKRGRSSALDDWKLEHQLEESNRRQQERAAKASEAQRMLGELGMSHVRVVKWGMTVTVDLDDLVKLCHLALGSDGSDEEG